MVVRVSCNVIFVFTLWHVEEYQVHSSHIQKLVSNKLSKVIIAKDLTIQQRDQNKKKRELKNKNNKQSFQKTKASEMKTIQEEVDDMEKTILSGLGFIICLPSLKAILISGSCIFISVHTSCISEWSYAFRAMLFLSSDMSKIVTKQKYLNFDRRKTLRK
jgi:preprotein translocase subunit SecF